MVFVFWKTLCKANMHKSDMHSLLCTLVAYFIPKPVFLNDELVVYELSGYLKVK
jgi:hypothetical protein